MSLSVLVQNPKIKGFNTKKHFVIRGNKKLFFRNN